MLFLCLEFHHGSSSWVKTPILLTAYESLHVLYIPYPYLSGFILCFCLPTHSTGLCAGPRTDLSCLHWPSLCLDHFWYRTSPFNSWLQWPGKMGAILNTQLKTATSFSTLIPLILVFFCPEYLSHSKMSYSLLSLLLMRSLPRSNDLFPSSIHW